MTDRDAHLQVAMGTSLDNIWPLITGKSRSSEAAGLIAAVVKKVQRVVIPASKDDTIPGIGSILVKSYWHNPKVRRRGIRTLPRIQLREAIGQGSFGKVYRIKLGGNQLAALKCIAKSESTQEKDLIKVKCEINAWRAVSEHPNVISLLAFFETDTNYCFIMEYASCGSLSSYLKYIEGPLEGSQAMTIAGQLAHAVYSLHSLGYLHRDLSCSNILLARGSKGQQFNCKMTDFGLSVRGHVSLNRCGSLAYMSPEVLDGTPYGQGADWWSYGIIVYTIHSGRTPLSMYTQKHEIDLASLSRESRYDVAKMVTIHLSRKLNSAQSQLIIDLLKNDPFERLGVIESGDFNCFKRHPYFEGFNWAPLDEVQLEKVPFETQADLPADIECRGQPKVGVGTSPRDN